MPENAEEPLRRGWRSACGAEQPRRMRHGPVAAAPFCIIERPIRRLDQASRRLAGLRHARLDPDADGYDAARRVRVRHQKLLDGTTRLLGKRGRLRDIEPG